MKKNILKVALVAAFALIAGYTVYTSQKSVDLSALALDNVEALAYYESPDVVITCGKDGGPCWFRSGDCYVGWFIRYDDCEFCGYTSFSCLTPC